MFLNIIFVQVAIVVGVIVLFFGSVFLNRLVKAPKDAKLPEKCDTCLSQTCMLKMTDVQTKKEELQEYLNNCEDENDQNTEKK